MQETAQTQYLNYLLKKLRLSKKNENLHSTFNSTYGSNKSWKKRIGSNMDLI